MNTTFKAGQVAPAQAAALPTVDAFIADADAPVDQLTARTAQLAALTSTLWGDGFENFQSHSSEAQHNVLWLVADLAAEVNRLADLVVCARAKGKA